MSQEKDPHHHAAVEASDIPADGGVGSSDSGGGYGLGPGGAETEEESNTPGAVGRAGGQDNATSDRALGNEQGGI